MKSSTLRKPDESANFVQNLKPGYRIWDRSLVNYMISADPSAV